MRVNIYAEEITDRVELVTKTNEDGTFTGIRFYLYLPVTFKGVMVDHGDPLYPTREGAGNISGPFLHRAGDDDSAAVTFWGKRALKLALRKALDLLDNLPEEL